MTIHKFFLGCGIMFVMLTAASFCLAETIPSCHDDIAVKHNAPGTSPMCTPAILSNDVSLDFLKKFGAKKIKQKWYIFLSEKDVKGGFDYASRWQTISLFVSAVQSLFNEKADCFIVQIPQTAQEKEALLAGKYPKELVAASGEHSQPEHAVNENDWPEYHHHLVYKLAVY